MQRLSKQVTRGGLLKKVKTMATALVALLLALSFIDSCATIPPVTRPAILQPKALDLEQAKLLQATREDLLDMIAAKKQDLAAELARVNILIVDSGTYLTRARIATWLGTGGAAVASLTTLLQLWKGSRSDDQTALLAGGISGFVSACLVGLPNAAQWTEGNYQSEQQAYLHYANVIVEAQDDLDLLRPDVDAATKPDQASACRDRYGVILGKVRGAMPGAEKK